MRGLTPRIRVCPECGSEIDWVRMVPPRRRKAPIVSGSLIAAPHVAAVLIGVFAPKGNQYLFGVSDKAIDVLLVLWVLSPVPTIAGLWMLAARNGVWEDRKMAAMTILGAVVPILLVPIVAMAALGV